MIENQNDNCFESLELKPELLHGIYGKGSFKNPTDLESRIIKPIIERKDVLIESPPGTGKCSSIVIGILQQIKTEDKNNQALIIAPNKYYSHQITDTFLTLSYKYEGLKIINTISSDNESNADFSDAQIIISKAKRATNLIEQKKISIFNMKIICFYDSTSSPKMFNDSRKLFTFIQNTTQILILSNKLSIIKSLIFKKYLKSPIQINYNPIQHFKEYYVDVGKNEYKLPTFLHLIGELCFPKTVVMFNSKDYYIESNLLKSVSSISAINYGMSSIDKFKTIKNSHILLLSKEEEKDEIHLNVDFLFNFDLPESKDQYDKRKLIVSGYQKRFIINLCNSDELKLIDDMNKRNKEKIEELPESFVEIMKHCLSIPSSVKKIGEYAFSGCKRLITIIIPPDSELEILDSFSFQNTPIVHFELPPKVVEIGQNCFNKCKYFRTIDFSKNEVLKTIGKSAFSKTLIENDVTKIRKHLTFTTINKSAQLQVSNFDGMRNLSTLHSWNAELQIERSSEFSGIVITQKFVNHEFFGFVNYHEKWQKPITNSQ